MFELIIISTLNGVLFGILLFLMASGLTVIFSMLGVLNFAHSSFYMLGAFFGFQLSRWVGFWPALVIGPVLAGLLGAAVERYGLRNAHERAPSVSGKTSATVSTRPFVHSCECSTAAASESPLSRSRPSRHWFDNTLRLRSRQEAS